MNGAQYRLELRVLGDFQVTRDGQPLDLPPSRKTRALLAYLAVTARQNQRERLCDIFWDIPDDPRGALRWSLSKIRQALGADQKTSSPIATSSRSVSRRTMRGRRRW
ncbi:AfsR/SARP family transcriptional regulator [Mesorhizobium atlanticum]